MLDVPSMEGLGAIVCRGAHCARRFFDLGALGNHCSKRLVASRSVRALASCAILGGTHCGNWTSVTAWRPDGVCSSRTWVIAVEQTGLPSARAPATTFCERA